MIPVFINPTRRVSVRVATVAGGSDGLTQVLAALGGSQSTVVEWNADSAPPATYEEKAGVDAFDTSVKHGGTASMRMDLQSPPGGADNGYKLLDGNLRDISLGDHFVQRWWMKFNTNFAWSNQDKMKAMRWKFVDERVQEIQTSYLSIGGYLPGEHASGWSSNPASGGGDEGPTIEYDFDRTTNSDILNWQEYIVEIKIHSTNNATDGWMKFYVYDEAGNGQGSSGPGNGLVGAITDIMWWSGNYAADPGVRHTWGTAMMNTVPQDASGNIWLDDFKMVLIT